MFTRTCIACDCTFGARTGTVICEDCDRTDCGRLTCEKED